MLDIQDINIAVEDIRMKPGSPNTQIKERRLTQKFTGSRLQYRCKICIVKRAARQRTIFINTETKIVMFPLKPYATAMAGGAVRLQVTLSNSVNWLHEAA